MLNIKLILSNSFAHKYYIRKEQYDGLKMFLAINKTG